MSAGEPPEIVVYSTPLCMPCEALKRFLKENGVPFVAKDLADVMGWRTSACFGAQDLVCEGEPQRPLTLQALTRDIEEAAQRARQLVAQLLSAAENRSTSRERFEIH